MWLHGLREEPHISFMIARVIEITTKRLRNSHHMVHNKGSFVATAGSSRCGDVVLVELFHQAAILLLWAVKRQEGEIRSSSLLQHSQ